MADFVAVLKKTLDGLGETTPETRAKVYDKARSTISAKLAAINPPPPASVAERQRRALEDAIASIERDYGRPKPAPVPASDPLAELENIFSSIDRNKNQSTHVRPAVRTEPVVAKAPPAPPSARTEPSWQQPARAPEPAWQKPAPAPAPIPTPKADAGWQKAPPPLANGFDKRPTIKPFEEDDDDTFFSDEGPVSEAFTHSAPEKPRRSYGGLIASVIVLALVAGGGYGIWLNQDAFKDMLGFNQTQGPKKKPVEKTAPAKPAKEVAATPPAETNPPADAAAAAPSEKFTQRLTPEGKEIDAGAAGGEGTIGEGTSVAALTTPPPAVAPSSTPPEAATPEPATAPADAAAPASAADGTATPPAADATQPADAAATPPPADTPAAPPTDAAAADTAQPTAPTAAEAQPAIPVGQKAIFYEERTSSAQGSAEPGSIVWSLVQESPGGDAPPEPAIRAEVSIPEKDVQLRMTIRRNTDQTLPASHIIEMIFLTPEGFEGGSIDNVLRIALKTNEQDAGNPLIGVPAKIADGFFLVALNDTKADENANLTLLRNQDWIDIPVVYKSGRRALLTMEKGIPGEKVFDDALKAWQAKTAG